MDRCYKLKVLILVLTCVLIPTKLIYSNGKDVKSSKRQSSIQVENLSQQKKEVINITNEELLLLSKLSVSNVILKRERYHIVQCIQRAINLLEHNAKAKNLTITTDFQNNEMVFIDVVKMEQVFL